MENELYEGFWKSDRNNFKIIAPTREELIKKIEDNKKKYQDHDPKVSNIKTDRTGRFYADMSILVNDKESKEDIISKTGRGLSKSKEYFSKAKESLINLNPSQSELKAKNEKALDIIMKKQKEVFPDTQFGRKKQNQDGSWYVTIMYKKPPKIQTKIDRINNIEKALRKLSNDKLQKIQDIISNKGEAQNG